jgi:hypothetical protein
VRSSTRRIVGGLLVSVVLGYAMPALATNTDEAIALCRARGSDCKGMKISADGNSVVILCVNNSSSGNGVQCVQCAAGQDCTVVRSVAGSNRRNVVHGVLNNKAVKIDKAERR